MSKRPLQTLGWIIFILFSLCYVIQVYRRLWRLENPNHHVTQLCTQTPFIDFDRMTIWVYALLCIVLWFASRDIINRPLLPEMIEITLVMALFWELLIFIHYLF